MTGRDRWRREVNLAIETARPAQRRIDRLDAIGSPDDDNAFRPLQPVHQRKELGHCAGIGQRAGGTAGRRNCVKLVDKDDGRWAKARFSKDASQVLFGLAAIGSNYLGTIDVEKLGVDLVGDAAGEQGFASARRAVKDDPAGGADPDLLVQVREDERQLDVLADDADLVA